MYQIVEEVLRDNENPLSFLHRESSHEDDLHHPLRMGYRQAWANSIECLDE